MKVISTGLFIILTSFSLNTLAQGETVQAAPIVGLEIFVDTNPLEEGGQSMVIKTIDAEEKVTEMEIPAFTGKMWGKTSSYDGPVVHTRKKTITTEWVHRQQLNDLIYLEYHGVIRGASIGTREQVYEINGEKRTLVRESCYITKLACHSGAIVLQPGDAKMLRELINKVGKDKVHVKVGANPLEIQK